MLWKEVKSWCKEKGYKTDRTKVDSSDNNHYHYTWYLLTNPEISGEAKSVSKLALSVYNHITNNIHVEYQTQYQQQILEADIDHDQGFGFQ